MPAAVAVGRGLGFLCGCGLPVVLFFADELCLVAGLEALDDDEEEAAGVLLLLWPRVARTAPSASTATSATTISVFDLLVPDPSEVPAGVTAVGAAATGTVVGASTCVWSVSGAGEPSRKSRTCAIDQRRDGSLTMVPSSSGASLPASWRRGGSSLTMR